MLSGLKLVDKLLRWQKMHWMRIQNLAEQTETKQK